MSLYNSLCLLLLLSLSHGSYSLRPRRTPHLDGLLPNGNFEQTPLKSNMKGRQIIGTDSLPHWQIAGHVELVSGGVNAVRLGNLGTISQDVRVESGLVYSLTFGATRTCAQDKNIKVSVPGQANELPLETVLTSDGGGDTYAWAFKAMSDVVKVTFHNPRVQEDPTCGPLIDVVAIKELPPLHYTKGNLVKNGGFEIGPHVFAKFSTGILIPPQSQDVISPLPGWIIESLKPVKYIDRRHLHVPFRRRAVEVLVNATLGQRAVELVSGRVTQIINTRSGMSYMLSLTAFNAGRNCSVSMAVEAFVGELLFRLPITLQGKGELRTSFFTFVAESNRTRLAFQSALQRAKVVLDPERRCRPALAKVILWSKYGT